MSMNSTDPSTFIGGKWTLIHDKFLWCTNYSGTEGGSFSVTLSKENLPPHNHGTQCGLLPQVSSNDPNFGLEYGGAGWRGNIVLFEGGSGHIGTTNTGSGKSFSILPPYKAVYCWYRTE